MCCYTFTRISETKKWELDGPVMEKMTFDYGIQFDDLAVSCGEKGARWPYSYGQACRFFRNFEEARQMFPPHLWHNLGTREEWERERELELRRWGMREITMEELEL